MGGPPDHRGVSKVPLSTWGSQTGGTLFFPGASAQGAPPLPTPNQKTLNQKTLTAALSHIVAKQDLPWVLQS